MRRACSKARASFARTARGRARGERRLACGAALGFAFAIAITAFTGGFGAFAVEAAHAQTMDARVGAGESSGGAGESTDTARSKRRDRSADPRLRALEESGEDATARKPGGVEALLQRDVVPRIVHGLDRPVDPDTYVIGPGDEFLLVVRGARAVREPLRVLPEGDVLVPSVGPMRAAGLTITAFRQRLREALGRFYRDVRVECVLVRPRTLVVYVLGEVAEPGAVEIGAPFRLDMALVAAGGLTRRASWRRITVRPDSGAVRTLDFMRFRRLGDTSQNPVLREGDVVYVPPRGAFCTVTGEVWRGAVYEVLPGETVHDVVALAGGFTPNAARDRVIVEHVDATEQVHVETLDAAALDTARVRNRDVVVVPDRRTFPGTDRVRIEGGEGREGRIPIAKNETIGAFLPRFIRLGDDHDLSHAVVERHLDDGTVQFIPVDLARVIDGRDPGDLVLRAGDVISIPVRDDNVYVTGRVVRPGPVPFQRGLPAARYIALAGGPTPDGSIDRLEIFDTNGGRRGGNRDAAIYRGETIVVKRRRTAIAGSLFFGLTTLTSLVLSIVAVTR